MRIGKVVGRVCLNPLYDTLVGGRFLIVEVQDRFALAGKARKTAESLVMYDHLGAGMGELVAFSILANNFTIPAATVNWIADLAVETLANHTNR